jgi:peroxiredoxin
MKTIKLFSIILIAFSINCKNALAQKANKNIVDFQLKNVDGKMVSLSDYPSAKGFIIVFTCNHCPFAKLYPPRLNDLNNKFKPLGVPLIAISSTDTMMYEEDTYPNMVIKANEEHFNFPYLFDEMQEVAKNFKAQKTPHAFVIWKKNNQWVIKYSGAIDDNGMEPEKVTDSYVSNAVNELLANQPIKTSETKSIGCQIAFRKK